MNITVNKNFLPQKFFTPMKKTNNPQESIVQEPRPNYATVPVSFRSYVNFTGNAPQITKATIVTSTAEDIPLEKTENGGYIVEPETHTELIYGKDATNYLSKISKFENDTQITFPKKAKGKLTIDGKVIKIKENSTVILNKGTEANVTVDKGYPQIIMSRDNYPWYNKYSNKQEQTPALRDKFKELIYRNSHTYNGEVKPCLFTKDDNKNNELATKLKDAGEISEQRSGYVKFEHYPTWDYKKETLTKKGFSDEELNIIEPVYKQVRQTKLDTKLALRSHKNGLSDETIAKLKENGVLFDTKKHTERIYWKKCFESEDHLRDTLNKKEITGKEQDSVVRAWNTDNRIGFDITGLKFINDNAAVYCLDDKVNNWSMEKSCWLTNSTALASKREAPTVGTSIVQADRKDPTPMWKLRSGEHLHIHPKSEDRSQTELYMITSGTAALTVVRDGVPKIKILKEGELAVIPPNTPHCVNSVMGEYEQVVSQIPSAFQYGLSFKQNLDMPYGYTEDQMEEEAKEELLQAKSDKN